jgi:hypothetical protein
MDEMVLVTNTGQGLILVGDRYLGPGERRRVPRAHFEAATRKYKTLALVGGPVISQEIEPPAEPPAELPVEILDTAAESTFEVAVEELPAPLLVSSRPKKKAYKDKES